MLHHFLIFSLLAHAIWALPAATPQQLRQQHPLGDIASHIVIVTPQAQVHLEPALKYDSAAFIQHLAPVARFASPHEETIVYYPASAAAAGSILPFEAANTIPRADAGSGTEAGGSSGAGTKQYETIIEQIQTAIQTGSSTVGPQLTEAATAAAAAAAAAGSSFFPGLFPGNPAGSEKAPESPPKLLELKPELAPTASQPLISDGRRFYALAPAPLALPHVIDFVHAPIGGPLLLSPLSTIRARSLGSSELPVAVLPTPDGLQPEALPLQKNKIELKENKGDSKKIEAIKEKEKEKEREKSKNNEFGRSLEAADLDLKERQQEPQKHQQGASEKLLDHNLKTDFVKPNQELFAANLAEAELHGGLHSGEGAKFQSKSALGIGAVGAGGVLVAGSSPVEASAGEVALPQAKIVA